ncbi:hypothetical protein ABPG72_015715 [Tetrahymena utriculariae]
MEQQEKEQTQINSKLPPRKPSKQTQAKSSKKVDFEFNKTEKTQTVSIGSGCDSNQTDSEESETEKISKPSVDSEEDANYESEYDSDEGFQEELSSDEEETFMQKFMAQTQNQIFFSIPNIEERGRKKNKIDPELPPIEKSYSLLPDMATGWRPKILTEQIPCPIPLYFADKNLNMITNKLQRMTKYPIVYLGYRPRTTFDVHRQFCGKDTYSFKFSSILFNEEVLKQFRVKIQDDTDTMQQVDNLRIFTGMHPDFKKSQLNFDSFFEGGNLDMVVKLSDIEYDLYMRPDTNTKGHQSWFYFKISNTKANQTVRFNVCNFQKKRSLYQRGLKPYILSQKDKDQFGQIWKQGGSNVYYSKRKNIKYDMLVNSSKQYYQMTFDYTFEYDNDEVYFAALPPYTYSDMRKFMTSDIITSNKQYLREVKLCRSLGGLFIPQINITDYQSDEIAVEQRKTFIISSRIHPGESISSFIAQGIIQYLLSDDEQVKELRKKVIFRVIPILNVDGTVIGNYRTSFSGLDLNRQFSQSDRQLLPEVYHLKRIVRKDHNMNNLIAFFDLHGHSVRKNCFIYGPYFAKNELNYYKSKFIPYLFSLRSNTFRYKSCKFTNQNYKKETARLVFHKQFGVFNSFTLEASFGLKDTSNLCGQTFEIKDYMQIGRDLVHALSDYIQKMEIFNKVKENSEQIKLKQDMEKAMKSPAQKDLGNLKKQNSIQSKNVQCPLNPSNTNSQSLNNFQAIKSRKASLLAPIIDKQTEDRSFTNIKEIIQGIKSKHGGKKYENESDRFSDAKIDSEDSVDDFNEDARQGINDGIISCVHNFKKQFVKPAENVQSAPKELVIVLNQPIEEDDKKKKKKKKSQNLRKEEIKLSKQYKTKFQEDDLMQQIFEDVIQNQKENSNAKRNPFKSINKFIKENYKEEDQSQQVIMMPRIDAFGSGSKLLPSVLKGDNMNNSSFNPYKETSNRIEVSSALSGSIQLQKSQEKVSDIFSKFYNDTENKTVNKLDKQSTLIPPKERSLTPLNLGKGNNSQVIPNNSSILHSKNFQNRVQLKMNIICEKNDTIKSINEKMKQQCDQVKSIDLDKSISFLKQQQLNTSSIQNSVVFDKEASVLDVKSSSDIPAEYTKGFSANIHNSNKNPYYVNNPVVKLKQDSTTPQNKTVIVLNSQNNIANETKDVQSVSHSAAINIHPKRYSAIESQNEDSNIDDNYVKVYGNVLQNCSNQIKSASSAQTMSSCVVQMPKLNDQLRKNSRSKDQQTSKRRSSQRKEYGMPQNISNQIDNSNKDLYNQQLPPRDFKTDKKMVASAKTPILNSLKSSNTKKRESSLDLQVRPFSIQVNNKPVQKLEDFNNENEISLDNKVFKQYQAFQVRQNNNQRQIAQFKVKNNNNTHKSFIM